MILNLFSITLTISLSFSSVPVYVILLSVKVEFLQFTFVIFNKDGFFYWARKLISCLLTESFVPWHDQVGIEACKTVPRGTNSHVWEYEVSDGQSLYGGWDRTVSPAGEGLTDDDSGSREASDDDEEPENFDRRSGSGDVNQAVNCRRFQKLLLITSILTWRGQPTNALTWPQSWEQMNTQVSMFTYLLIWNSGLKRAIK